MRLGSSPRSAARVGRYDTTAPIRRADAAHRIASCAASRPPTRDSLPSPRKTAGSSACWWRRVARSRFSRSAPPAATAASGLASARANQAAAWWRSSTTRSVRRRRPQRPARRPGRRRARRARRCVRGDPEAARERSTSSSSTPGSPTTRSSSTWSSRGLRRAASSSPTTWSTRRGDGALPRRGPDHPSLFTDDRVAVGGRDVGVLVTEAINGLMKPDPHHRRAARSGRRPPRRRHGPVGVPHRRPGRADRRLGRQVVDKGNLPAPIAETEDALRQQKKYIEPIAAVCQLAS